MDLEQRNPRKKGASIDSRRRAWLKSLSPPELTALRNYAWERLALVRRINVNGKQVSLKSLTEDLEKRREYYEHGLFGDDVRQMPRREQQRLVPSSHLRPGSQKQMLRKDDEDALELQRMGHGCNFASEYSIFGRKFYRQRNFSYGIFARPGRVHEEFASTWSGRDPEAVLEDPRFYDDILRRCNQVELTLMLVTSRPLSFEEIRPQVEGTIRKGMQRVNGEASISKENNAALERFIHFFDVSVEKRIQQCEWVQDGKIKEGTHFILATTPKGGLTAEAISPGPIGRRKTSLLGVIKRPLLTAAVFDAFIGPDSIDDEGKKQIGTGFLWAANGLPFKMREAKPGQPVGLLDADNSSMKLDRKTKVNQINAAKSIFRLKGSAEATAPMLLNKLAMLAT